MNAAIQTVNMAGQMSKTIDEVLKTIDSLTQFGCDCSECETLRDAAKAIRAQNDVIHELQQNLADSYFPAPTPSTVDENDIPF